MQIIDTNILLHYPSVLENNKDIVISIRVIEELDRLKNYSLSQEIAYKARRASHMIFENKDNIYFCNDRYNKMTVDDEIIAIAKKHKWTVITNDLNVRLKCEFNKVNNCSYYKANEEYSGVKYIQYELDSSGYNEDLNKLISTKTPNFEMYENEFLIVNSNEFSFDKYGNKIQAPICAFINKNGKLEQIDKQYLKNDYMGKISARNIEQECLIKLLKDNNISIVLAAGTFGVGKSFLIVNYALQELEKGNINKIIYVPNNSFNADTREIGALPGDLFEKESIHMGTLMDMIGPITVQEMVNREKIEIAPISTMRGRSFNNSIIIVNEAQNLTEDHVKLLIARCGDGTKIIFDGDIKQTDNLVFKNKNGLKLLTNLKDSRVFGKIFGTVKLKTIERSFTAQASAYLDDLI